MIKNSSIGSAEAERKRYRGRSASRPQRPEIVPQEQPAPRPEAEIIPLRRREKQSKPNLAPIIARAHTPALGWSVRLVVAVSVVLLLGVGLRATALFVPPVDAPIGVQATYAAQANVLAGRVAWGDATVRALPPSAPWIGAANADPASGLPLYTWLLGYGMRFLGLGEWLGRALSLFFSAGAGFLLFALVRRAAGARAAMYSLLIFSVSPLSVALGSQLAPFALSILAQVGALFALLWWRATSTEARPSGSAMRFTTALILGALAAALSPSALSLAVPAAPVLLVGAQTRMGLRHAWDTATNRGRYVGYVGAMLLAASVWALLAGNVDGGLVLAREDGGGGLAANIAALFTGGNYVQIVGAVVGKALTIVGLLLVGAGLLQGGRPPMRWLFHAWLGGAAVMALLDAQRITRHDDVLLPLLAPLCALAGLGAAWAGSLPSRVWLALVETRRERDSDYAVSPHTAWLLDLPEERATPGPARPQAKPALSRSLMQRSREAGARVRQVGLMMAGHLAVLGSIAFIGASGWNVAAAQGSQPEASVIAMGVGSDLAQLTPPGAKIIVAGPNAAEIFYGSRRTGWALPSTLR